jgi:hypothetical protein
MGQQRSFRTYQRLPAYFGGTEATGKHRQPMLWKEHRDRNHFIDKLKPFPLSTGRNGEDLSGAKQGTGSVDAIHSHVVNGASAFLDGFAHTHIVGDDRLTEVGAENGQVSQPPASGQLDGMQVSGFEMQPVNEHQLHPVLLRRRDHSAAVLLRDCHWFLPQDVNTSWGRALGQFPVEMIWDG